MSLTGVLRNLFIEQEEDRIKLRVKQIVEKEKLVLAVEQVSALTVLALDSTSDSGFHSN